MVVWFSVLEMEKLELQLSFLFMGNQVLTSNMNAQILPAYTGLGFMKELKVLAREMYMHVFSTRQHMSRMNFFPFLLFLLNA